MYLDPGGLAACYPVPRRSAPWLLCECSSHASKISFLHTRVRCPSAMANLCGVQPLYTAQLNPVGVQCSPPISTDISVFPIPCSGDCGDAPFSLLSRNRLNTPLVLRKYTSSYQVTTSHAVSSSRSPRDLAEAQLCRPSDPRPRAHDSRTYSVAYCADSRLPAYVDKSTMATQELD